MLFKEFDNWLSKDINKLDYIRSNRNSIINFRRYRLKDFDSLNLKNDDIII